MAMRKKGFFFIIDALLATAILLGGIMILSNFYINEQPTVLVNYISEDILKAFATLRIYELNNTNVNELITNGTIVNLNNSILDQIGEFWAADNIMLANAFTKNISEDLLPPQYGIGIWVSDELIYQRDYPPPSTRSSARKIISGIEKNKPTKGFIANAHANSYTKTTTQVISFSPEGSGWYGTTSSPGESTIVKYFSLPSGINITNASMYISMHIEDGGNNWNVLNINGLSSPSCNLSRNNLNFYYGEEGVFNKKDIKSCLNPGWNKITLRLRNQGYHGHIHPGMFIKVDYILNETTVNYDKNISLRYYFDNVTSSPGSDSQSGAWAILPFFIPDEATNISTSLSIKGKI